MLAIFRRTIWTEPFKRDRAIRTRPSRSLHAIRTGPFRRRRGRTFRVLGDGTQFERIITFQEMTRDSNRTF